MAVETLRPSSGGDVTQLYYFDGSGHAPDVLHNWEQVDETTPDSDSTYVYMVNDNKYDLYNIPAPAGGGTINFVKVYNVGKASAGGAGHIGCRIKTEGDEYSGGDYIPTTSYVSHSNQWNTNPKVGGAWTWPQIAALQIGIYVEFFGSGENGYVTQVYVEVDYTPAVAKPHTFSLDPRPGKRIKFHPNLKLG